MRCYTSVTLVLVIFLLRFASSVTKSVLSSKFSISAENVGNFLSL